MPQRGGVKGAQAFGKAIAVLNLIADAPRAPRFVDLMAAAGLPKGTLHRIVSALIDQRLVRLNARDQTYRLGPRLFELAHRVWANFDLRDAAAAELQRLAELWRGTVHLAVPDGAEALIIDLAEPPQPFRLPFGVGRRLPLYATALGKAILAFLAPDARAEALAGLKLAAITPRTIVDRARLELDLDLAVVRGYALDDEELETGIRCVAAPILDHTGAPIGAISVSQPVFRIRIEEMHVAARDVLDAARQIAGNAGATPVFSISTPPRPAGEPPKELACALPVAGLNAESPLWNAAQGALLWVDLLDPHLGALRPGAEQTKVPLADLVSCIALREAGGLVAATRHGIAALDLASGRLTPIAGIEADRPRNRPNDGRCDRRGRFWVGTMAMDAAVGHGALYRVEPDGKVVRVDSGFGVSNGIAWSPDDRFMYFVDSRARTIYRYRFDLASGSAEGREVFVDLSGQSSGNPAGIAVDAEGFVWSAVWDGWSVMRFAPSGRVDRVVRLPVPRPTSCTFGGRRLATLYITTSRSRLSRERLRDAPLSGSIFTLPVSVRGQAETPFAG